MINNLNFQKVKPNRMNKTTTENKSEKNTKNKLYELD